MKSTGADRLQRRIFDRNLRRSQLVNRDCRRLVPRGQLEISHSSKSMSAGSIKRRRDAHPGAGGARLMDRF